MRRPRCTTYFPLIYGWGELKMFIVCTCIQVYIFAYISKKKKDGPKRIKQETDGNYLKGNGNKEWKKQNRKEKAERQVEMYTFTYTYVSQFSF